jgi:hypothetical protein
LFAGSCLEAAQPLEGVNLSCNPPAYAKASENVGSSGKTYTKIVAEGETYPAKCADILVKGASVDDGTVSTEAKPKTPDSKPQIRQESDGTISCVSDEGTSTVTFGPTGYKVASLTFQDGENKFTLAEGEEVGIQSEDGPAKLKFARGMLTKDGNIIFHANVTPGGDGTGGKTFEVTIPKQNLGQDISKRESSVPLTSAVVVGFTVCD